MLNPENLYQIKPRELTPFDALADAVLRQAADDYRELLAKGRRFPNCRQISEAITELEEFFVSDWYFMLVRNAHLTGEAVMKRIRKEIYDDRT